MRCALLLAVLFALNAGAENLIANGGFEVVAAGAPAEWSVFVQPKPGASSFLDQRVAEEGSSSVRLTIETPYIDDPANNWSQNVLTDVRGKRLHLKGYIKTENATEAAIWVQCYAKNPLRLVIQESTSSKGLLTGTNDWTPVEATVDAPPETDFVVVRCVLRFRGTAWFDAISLEAVDTVVPPTPMPAVTKTPTPALKMPTTPTMPALPDVVAPAPEPSSPPPANPQEFLQAHEELRKTNWQLRQSNSAMSKQLEELRTQIEELKRQIQETAAAARQLQEEQARPVERDKPVEVPPPPLVPDEDAP